MAEWDLLAEGRSPRKYRTGQLIYLQGTHPDCFYYLLSGSVRSFISSSTGEERVLTVVGSSSGLLSTRQVQELWRGSPRAISALPT